MTPNRVIFRPLDGVKFPMLHTGMSFRAKKITVGTSASVHTRHHVATFGCGYSLPWGNIKVIDGRGCFFNKRTMVTGHEHWPRPICYLLDQERYGIVVKMIGGFIQDQKCRSSQKDPHQFEPACLPRDSVASVRCRPRPVS